MMGEFVRIELHSSRRDTQRATEAKSVDDRRTRVSHDWRSWSRRDGRTRRCRNQWSRDLRHAVDRSKIGQPQDLLKRVQLAERPGRLLPRSKVRSACMRLRKASNASIRRHSASATTTRRPSLRNNLAIWPTTLAPLVAGKSVVLTERHRKVADSLFDLLQLSP